MAIRTYPGTFRTSVTGLTWANTSTGPSPLNLLDNNTPGAWGSGVTLIDKIVDQTPSPSWKVLAYSVNVQLVLTTASNLPQVGGKLGKLVTSLILDPITTGGSVAGVAYVNQQLEYPADMTMSETLWDGSTDPTPPLVANTAAALALTLPITKTVNLSQPIDLLSHDLGIGLWLSPSLSIPNSNWSPCVTRGRYTVVYDDGR